MKKYFNVAGPCVPGEHYMLPAQERCRDIIELIEQKQYFVIHAARQTGKTTLLQELTQQINAAGRFCALLLVRSAANRFVAGTGHPGDCAQCAASVQLSSGIATRTLCTERRL